MDLLFHPAFQSLVLPLCLAIAATALLQRVAGPRRAAFGAALGLVLALAVFPGFDWPALTRAQKLPWIVLAATLLAAGLAEAGWARGVRAWAVACLSLASLALAVWAALSGSLLLAQLALTVATTTAVLAIWAAWGRQAAPASALLPATLAWLMIATALLPPAGPAPPPAQDDPYLTPQEK